MMTENSRQTNVFRYKKFLNLFRALFPKWDFFNEVAYTFELKFKSTNSDSWKTVSFAQSRSLWGLFYNSQMNEAMAQFNLVEHFAQEVLELQKNNCGEQVRSDKSIESYSFVVSLLRIKMAELGFKSSGFNFRISATSPSETIDIFESGEIPSEPF